MDQLLYRPKEAAAVLGRSKTALYGLIRANRIRSIKDGKFRFITAEALARVRTNTRKGIRGSELDDSKSASAKAAPGQR